MPFDAASGPEPPRPLARPIIPYIPSWRPPPHLTELTEDDERILAALEAGWAHLHGPIDPQDDDLPDRWDDDDASPTTEALPHGYHVDALTAAAQAEWPDMDRPTLVALMAHAGHLTRISDERRYILSQTALDAKVGRNVRPKRGRVFPIIYPEHVSAVLRSLGWPEIKERIASLPDGRARRSMVVSDLPHLPVSTLVRLSGAKRRTIELDLARQRDRETGLIADLRMEALAQTPAHCGFADIPEAS